MSFVMGLYSCYLLQSIFVQMDTLVVMYGNLPLSVYVLYTQMSPVLCGKQHSYPTVIASPLPVKGTQPIAPTLRPDRRGGGVGLARRVVTVA